MPNNSSSINLIRNKASTFDKIMSWTLTIGRLIIILTEVVALSAFVYRFSLDEKLIELHSSIKQKQVVVSLLKQDEDKYRNLQDRIALASTFTEKSSKSNESIQAIFNLISPGIIINNLTLNKERVNINVNASSISQLNNFVSTLKDYPQIASISIDNIESKPSGLSINISIILKK